MYFWVVAREGSIVRASEQLRLAQPTLSGQIRALEEALGQKLFTRSGRGIVLTDFGRLVYRHADEIFKLGNELLQVTKGRPVGRPIKFQVGVVDVVPKLVVYRLLEPALRLPEAVHIICREDRQERLLADLALHELDLVLSDTPLTPGGKIKAYHHLLGECGVTLVGVPSLIEAHREPFPQSLNQAPFLLPMEGTVLRRALDNWFAARQLQPRIVGEFEDSATLKTFGQAGAGLFAIPSIIEKEVLRQYQIRILHRIPEIRERFYAITVERKLKHPAVVAISETARQETFGSGPV